MLPLDEKGSGEAVMLLHAGVADRTMWSDHLDWLAAAGFRAIAVDLPGFGEAPIEPGPQAPWEDVLRTLSELGVSQAVLVGNSFGGAVALRAAAVAPAAASKLALISSPPLDLDPSPALAAAWQAEEGALQRGDIDGAVAAVVNAWLLPTAPPDLRERVARMQRRAFELQRAAPEAEEAPDPLASHPEVLSELRVPALAAAGEHDLPDFKQAAEQLAERLPNARSTEILNAGHLAPLEAPVEFRELLLGFLRPAAEVV